MAAGAGIDVLERCFRGAFRSQGTIYREKTECQAEKTFSIRKKADFAFSSDEVRTF